MTGTEKKILAGKATIRFFKKSHHPPRFAWLSDVIRLKEVENLTL